MAEIFTLTKFHDHIYPKPVNSPFDIWSRAPELSHSKAGQTDEALWQPVGLDGSKRKMWEMRSVFHGFQANSCSIRATGGGVVLSPGTAMEASAKAVRLA